jgi:Ala-tRNA(Pro) deacylase
MRIPPRLIEFLNQQNVPYEVLHHPVAYTAQELSAIEGVRGHEHAKVVMVMAGGRCSMVVLPSDHRVQLEKLAVVLGHPAALAGEADFRALFPDCEIGTMPPFGGLYGVPTYVDRHFLQNERITFEAGTHSDAIRMKCADYERLAQPVVADFADKFFATPRPVTS